jgi:hypothetical protein
LHWILGKQRFVFLLISEVFFWTTEHCIFGQQSTVYLDNKALYIWTTQHCIFGQQSTVYLDDKTRSIHHPSHESYAIYFMSMVLDSERSYTALCHCMARNVIVHFWLYIADATLGLNSGLEAEICLQILK